MRLQSWAGWMPVLLALLGGPVAAATAPLDTLICGSASGLAGQTVNVPIVFANHSGVSFSSYEFSVGYAANLVTAVGVGTDGTLTGGAGWGTPTFLVTSGRISVAGAGVAPVTGSGTLLNLSFMINPAQLGAGSVVLTPSGAILNEGSTAVAIKSGALTINATPFITVSPATAEIVRGTTLQFTASGSVSPPVTWSTTDPAVAGVSSGGLLTGIAAGAVKVVAVDAAGHRDSTNGDIVVRAMGVTIGTVTAALGQAVSVPVTTTSLTGLGVRAGELKVIFDNTRLGFVSASAPQGTLLHGSGTLGAGASVNGTTTTLTIVTGGTDLAGAGTLFDLDMTASSSLYGVAPLTLSSALFNETLPALRTNGAVSVSAPSAFSVLPASISLLAGQKAQFSLSGPFVSPIAWSTLDPAVATIDGAGMLTAVAGGVTAVRASDASGGSAQSTAVNVADFGLSIGSLSAMPGETIRIPLKLDRDLTPLNVFAVELALAWPPTWVTSAAAGASGALNAWGAPRVLIGNGNARMSAAGGTALSGSTNVLSTLDLKLSPSTPVPTDLPITITSATFNEGRPLAQVTAGVVHVVAGVDVPAGASLEFSLAPAAPNPVRAATRIGFTLPSSAAGETPVRLAILGVDGRLVRTLCDEPLGSGPHERTWDARDEGGHLAAPGIYLVRLEAPGGTLRRKLVLIR